MVKNYNNEAKFFTPAKEKVINTGKKEGGIGVLAKILSKKDAKLPEVREAEEAKEGTQNLDFSNEPVSGLKTSDITLIASEGNDAEYKVGMASEESPSV